MPRVPDRTWFDPVLNCWLHTGANAIDAAIDFMSGPRVMLATDIETPGLEKSFTINCVTMAYAAGRGVMHTLLLDPDREPGHDVIVRDMYQHASEIVLHNAPFDVPGLYHAGLIDDAGIAKIIDTLVLARFAFPDTMIPKNLTALSIRHLGLDDFKGGMELAFKAAGFKTIGAGYEGMDINSPVYRQGAMADTVATLRLEPIIRQLGIELTLDHPFPKQGATTVGEASAIMTTQEVVHRVMLRRSAVGLAVDADYLERYGEGVEIERRKHIAELEAVGLEGGTGKGKKILEYLESIGELPAGWPRTANGGLKATKDLLDAFDHPLAVAQRSLADSEKILGYLTKVARQAEVTGRCHPQVGTLGASATGRTSYSTPELQQFPKDARPIIRDDGQGLTSIDWSQIEPVTMALMARDDAFLAPFERGEDLYGPIQIAAGIDRPLAKVVLLATMYGQGAFGLSKRINHTEESASQIRRQMLAAMPMSAKWMSRVQGIAEQYGKVITAGGRILPVDSGGVFRSVNYTVQGSAYDVLAHTIERMHEDGIADHVQLTMHDEVVVDTEVAEHVQRIMETPPPWLERWAGRTPVLRTDREDLGHAWAKV
jgi:DNA polymerase-1